jgi:hypothetical protein
VPFPVQPPAARHLVVGELLAGRFRLVRFVGRGGMGDVYEAEDQELGERVALKTVRAEIAHLPGAIERFRREIQLARKVTHPNVCRIFDVFRDRPDGAAANRTAITFFSMELLLGDTLERRLREGGRMTPAEALPVVSQMAEGLGAAHRAGVVHRDFKPANVMLVPASGAMRAVITDFGLARTYDDGENLTLRGNILGTPSYMAPEQITGAEVTAATDIYALGCVLYEMVTGAPPFVGANSFSTAFKRLQEDPRPPHHSVPGLDPAWDAVILRCLERDPADRFASAPEVAAALGGGQVARPSGGLRRARRRRRTLIAAGGAAAVAALAVLAALGGARWLHPGAGRGERGLLRHAAPLADWMRGPEELYQSGLAALAKLDGPRAQELFEKAVAARPDSWLAHSGLALALEQLGHEQRAAQEAKVALDHAAALPAEQRLLVTARYYQVTGHPDRAAESYQELQRLAPDNPAYGLSLAYALSGAGHGHEALQLLAALRAQPAAAEPGMATRIGLAEAEMDRALADFPNQTEAARRATELAERDGDELLAARGLFLQALALDKRGDHQGSLAAYRRAEATYAGTGDQRHLAEVLGGTAAVFYFEGKLDQAKEKANEALDSFKEVGDLRGQSRQLDLLAAIDGMQGKPAEAEARYAVAVQAYHQLGDRVHEAQASGNLGMALASQGKTQAAEGRLLQALELYRQLHDRSGEAKQLFSLAGVALSLSHLSAAEAYLEESLSIATAIDDQALLADALVTKGNLAAARGDLAAARGAYQDSLTKYRNLDSRDGVAVVQLSLANLELEEGHPSSAEVYARQAEEAFHAEHAGPPEAEALTVLSEALLAEGAAAPARRALDEAEHLAGRDPAPQIVVELAQARAQVEEPANPGEATRVLTRALGAATAAGLTDLSLEVRLQLAEITARHAAPGRAAPLLSAVENDARSRGYLHVAERAAKARTAGAAHGKP